MDVKLKTINIAIGAVVVIIVGYLLIFSGGGKAITQAKIQKEYEQKIIYASNRISGDESLRAHCAAKGGVFNSCGTSCAPAAEVCTAMCANVCEFVRINE